MNNRNSGKPYKSRLPVFCACSFLKEIGRKRLIKVILLGNRFPNHAWHQE